MTIPDEHFDYINLDTNNARIENDIKAWYPKLKKGGYMGGHSIYKPLVSEAVERVFGKNYECSGELSDFRLREWWVIK